MSCNPCCCWRLKDAAVTVGIWSLIYAFASLAMFGWQWGVLSQCQHVTMAQANLQCDWYCPCVGASTARTSAIIEALFVVQILCLISAFFLLFASVLLIYGIHTWSRFLLWPWFISMLCSILTSLAYCIVWWSGDVRDYWLVLTILQFFSVLINVYVFVVIWVFYKNMADELRYYEGRRAKKYDRFSYRGTPQTTENEGDEDDFGPDNYGIQQQPIPQQQQWDDNRWAPKYTVDPRYRKMPLERFDSIPPNDFDSGINTGVQPAQSMPTLFDDFRDVPRQHHRQSVRRKHCSHCHKDHHRHSSHHRHRHPSRHRRKLDSCSSTCSTDLTTEDTVSTHPQGRHRRHHSHHDHKRSSSRNRRRNHHSDDEISPEMETVRPKNTTRRYVQNNRAQRLSAVVQVDADELPPVYPNAQFPPTGGISIPQHIVIPPEPDLDSSGQPRKYQINSEITISYDPQQQQMATSPHPEQSFLPLRPNPVSITSNV